MDRGKGSALTVVLGLVAVLALVGGAYLYGQTQKLKNPPITPVSSLSPSVVATSLPTPTPPASKVTVVFEAEGSFSQSEKDELKKKVIDPLSDYYTTESDQVLLTLTISKNDKASKDQYPYQGQAVFQGGGNMGFLIMKIGTGVDWWYPECLNGCTLSASYKAKYPEIASKVQ